VFWFILEHSSENYATKREKLRLISDQIFNKITKDECEVYDKVTFGTLFTNLFPILFNWEVRKAFALSQVPELKTTNSDFGSGIYTLCQSIWPKFSKSLSTYIIYILEQKRRELKDELHQARQYDSIFNFGSIVVPVCVAITMSANILTFIFISNYMSIYGDKDMVPLYAISICSLFGLIIGLLLKQVFNQSYPRKHRYKNLREEIENIDIKISGIKNTNRT
jgi:hypothetical protein